MPECPCLILEKASNGIDGVAALEFDGERVLVQRHARFSLIRPQGRLEKGLKAIRFRLLSHITAGQEMGLESRYELAERN